MNFLVKFIRRIDENPKYFWSVVWVIFGLALGLFFTTLYNRELLNTGAACIWSLAYFVAGALIGMVFGVPNVPPVKKDINDGTNKTVADAPFVSTNLAQISDWLTKVVIGAGLVEITKIPSFIVKVSLKMAVGVAVDLSKIPQVSMICVAILIYNTCFGFISGYLLMRIIFNSLTENKNNFV